MTKFMTASAVAEMTTLSRSTIERKVKEGAFPAPVQLSERRKAWRAEVVEAWMKEKGLA